MNNQENTNIRIKLCLSAQRALLGAINSNILGIYIQINPNDAQLVVYVSGSLSPEETEALDIACTEMIADLYPPIIVVLKVVENAREPLRASGIWVFLRYGVKTDGAMEQDG